MTTRIPPRMSLRLITLLRFLQQGPKKRGDIMFYMDDRFGDTDCNDTWYMCKALMEDGYVVRRGANRQRVEYCITDSGNDVVNHARSLLQ